MSSSFASFFCSCPLFQLVTLIAESVLRSQDLMQPFGLYLESSFPQLISGTLLSYDYLATVSAVPSV